VLIKSFKYFDLNDSGSVEPDEFAKAIEKIGIMIPTKQVSTRESKTSPSLSAERLG
jgi:Ca2+-binding EF-hand superfamily protein